MTEEATTTTTAATTDESSSSTDTTATQNATPKTTITTDMIMQVCPQGNRKHAEEGLAYLSRAMAKKQMTSKNQLVAVVATWYTETRSLAPVEEYGKGGGRYVRGGQSYHGRGYVQLTHKGNYQNFGESIGQDIAANPNLVLKPEVASEALTWYWCAVGPGLAHDMRPYGDKGDWQNVRSIVNAGSPGRWGVCHGKDIFMATVKKGLEVFPSGIDPNAPLPGNYGVGCADADSITNLTGTHLPNSQGSAMDYALKLMDLNSNKSHILRARLNVQAYPKLLDLDVQTTFKAIGLGADLDEEYTIEEINFILEDVLLAEVIASKRDPNAPQSSIFRLNTNASDLSSTQTAPLPEGSGDIPARLRAAADAYRGTSTAAGPEGGNLACAWAVSHVLQRAGLKTIGSDNNSIVLSVNGIEQGLNAGRGQQVVRETAKAGDIWLVQGKHIGFCMTDKCTRVLSNSSSKATFTWEDDIDTVNSYYRMKENLYRVTS